MVAEEKLPGVSHYYIGNDRTRWREHVPHFAKVKVEGAYPGIDLVYYGNGRRLEYDFVLAPGADPDVIRLAYDGVDSGKLDDTGDLILATALGDLRQHRPKVYQEVAGHHTEIAADYRVLSNQHIAFSIGDYDYTKLLVIDPVISWASTSTEAE